MDVLLLAGFLFFFAAVLYYRWATKRFIKAQGQLINSMIRYMRASGIPLPPLFEKIERDNDAR